MVRVLSVLEVPPSLLKLTAEENKSFNTSLRTHAFLLSGAFCVVTLILRLFGKPLFLPWYFFVLFLGLFTWIGSEVVRESVTVTRYGFQLRAVRRNGLSARNEHIPLEDVSSVIINEGFVCFSCETYVALVQESDTENGVKKYCLLFDYTKFDVETNRKIYLLIKEHLKEYRKLQTKTM